MANSGRKPTHGMSGTKIHGIWNQLHSRCRTISRKDFHRYGDRGIRVCPEWAEFKSFYTWAMENGYQEGLQIDRIDNNGNYEPNNCRFSTPAENSQNQTRTKLDIGTVRLIREFVAGKAHSLRHIGRLFNITHEMVRRIRDNTTWRENT